MIKIKQDKIEELENGYVEYFYDIMSNDVAIGKTIIVDRGYFTPVLIKKIIIYDEFSSRDRYIWTLEYIMFLVKFFKSKRIEYVYDAYSSGYNPNLVFALNYSGFVDVKTKYNRTFRINAL